MTALQPTEVIWYAVAFLLAAGIVAFVTPLTIHIADGVYAPDPSRKNRVSVTGSHNHNADTFVGFRFAQFSAVVPPIDQPIIATSVLVRPSVVGMNVLMQSSRARIASGSPHELIRAWSIPTTVNPACTRAVAYGSIGTIPGP